MINWICYYWQNYKFEFLIILSILLLILYFIFKNRINNIIDNNQELQLTNKTNFEFKSTNIIPKKNEKRCREIFQQIFNKPFPNVRPEFLRRLNKNNK